jgi:hypothetical protein
MRRRITLGFLLLQSILMSDSVPCNTNGEADCATMLTPSTMNPLRGGTSRVDVSIRDDVVMSLY